MDSWSRAEERWGCGYLKVFATWEEISKNIDRKKRVHCIISYRTAGGAMRNFVVTLASVIALGTSTFAQERWAQIDLEPEGMEYRLMNEDGATIILSCQAQGILAGFAFPEALEETERATVRSIPGQRLNVRLVPINEQVVQIWGLAGTRNLLSLIRDAPRLYVRVGGESAMFRTAGSYHIVDGCFERQQDLPGDIAPIGQAPLPSPCLSSPTAGPCLGNTQQPE